MFEKIKHLIAQFVKFGVVGGISFVIDYGCMVLFTECFSIDYLISSTLSFIISVTFNYIASMKYVFGGKEGMSKRKEFIIFIVLSVIGLGINELLMWLGVEFAGVHYMITKIFATAVVMVFNFVTRKIFLED